MAKAKKEKIKITLGQALALLGPYVRKRLMEQVKSVWLIILYLVLFQIIVLGVPIAEAGLIAVGIALVIVGLTFFMEGLLLGLMPLGEVVGIKLPQKSSLPVILGFALMLGFLATLAEPAIQVLQTAGETVRPFEAPLLFTILNTKADVLVYSVGGGVGLAVAFGTLRFLYNWSLKPFIYILISLLLGLTAYSFYDPNMQRITGLAWDCGAVTTGPVTVPLVLALGIGISRMTGSGDSASAGFGVVTLASLFPIITVLGLGLVLGQGLPDPSSESEFYKQSNRDNIIQLYKDEAHLNSHTLQYASAEGQAVFFGSEPAMLAYVRDLAQNEKQAEEIFGSVQAVRDWVLERGTDAQQLAVFGSIEAVIEAQREAVRNQQAPIDAPEVLLRNFQAAAQAIGLLSIPLILVLFLILRERLPQADETLLGLSFAVIGMMIFSIGIELGLDPLGRQVGQKLPASFKPIELAQSSVTIQNFDPDVVQRSITEDGTTEEFFFSSSGRDMETLPYKEENYNAETGTYSFVPTHGPLFGKEGGLAGIAVVLLFAFIMGYGATLAEPALNALGLTVEEITVGTFKKSLLMQTVAIGVGIGILMGVVKIVWDLPLMWLLVPPYLLLLLITKLSTEEFVNIGWDSAGVTTGPITVPLVLAMGLGIGNEIGVVEGFGILSMASVCPIMAVLLVGLNVTRKRNQILKEAEKQDKERSLAVGG